MRGFVRRGLPRTPTVDQTNPDLQLLFGSLYYHGALTADPDDAREGELWLRTDLDPVELRGRAGGITLVFSTGAPA